MSSTTVPAGTYRSTIRGCLSKCAKSLNFSAATTPALVNSADTPCLVRPRTRYPRSRACAASAPPILPNPTIANSSGLGTGMLRPIYTGRPPKPATLTKRRSAHIDLQSRQFASPLSTGTTSYPVVLVASRPNRRCLCLATLTSGCIAKRWLGEASSGSLTKAEFLFQPPDVTN